MGSWNETCMITNLPIVYNDPVVCQVIVQAPFASPMKSAATSNHPFDRFCPVGWPFRAKYNDYGYIKDIEEDAFTNDTLDYMRSRIVERELGENRYHDHAVSRAALSWETLDDWFRGKRVLFENAVARAYPEYPQQRSVGLVMIHQTVYETMAAYRNEWEGYGRGTVEEEIEKAFAARGSGEAMPSRPKSLLIWRINRLIRGREMNHPLDLLDSQAATKDEIAARLAKMVHFETAMTYARKQWMPTSGAGSQSEEWGLFERIDEAGKLIAERRKEELAEDEDE